MEPAISLGRGIVAAREPVDAGNHVPDAGSTIMLMGLALTVLGGVRHKRKL